VYLSRLGAGFSQTSLKFRPAEICGGEVAVKKIFCDLLLYSSAYLHSAIIITDMAEHFHFSGL
jgi:hypothetical protein